eukprot:Sdes_comp19520_c0_seq2m11096
MNIIEVIDFCVLDSPKAPPQHPLKNVYILLPFFRKGSLQNLIEALSASNQRLSESQILAMFKGICLGVEQLHSFSSFHPSRNFSFFPEDQLPLQGEPSHHNAFAETPSPASEPPPVPQPLHHSGLAHRDIKPANILISDDNTPVLIDFGSVSKAKVQIRTRAEALLLEDSAAEKSSLPYRAPELLSVPSQCLIDERVDIWSLGCTLYAMAYLRSPFESILNSNSGDSVLLSILSGKVNFPPFEPSTNISSPSSPPFASYSSQFQDLVLFMLNPNPLERPFIGQVLSRIDSLLLSSNRQTHFS